MFKTRAFNKLLDKATSNLLTEPDWETILEICDLIDWNDVQPRTALNAIKVKLTSPNPDTAMYAVQLLESLVKNCGNAVHDELTTKAYCDMLHDLTKNTPHDIVRKKLLELIQTCCSAFRKQPQHSNLKDLMATMKSNGFKFPPLPESEAVFTTEDTAPDWVDGAYCHRCCAQFGMILHKHNCRACGQVFCSQCSQKNTTLPKFGIKKKVKVCDVCYDLHTNPSSAKSSEKNFNLPQEYLKRWLSQQNQNNNYFWPKLDSFKNGTVINIKGKTPSNGARFDINFQEKCSNFEKCNIGYHISVRYSYGYVASNSFRVGHGWEHEIRSYNLPIKPGNSFEFSIYCTESKFLVVINGNYFCKFENKVLQENHLKCLQVQGDVILTCVEVESAVPEMFSK